MDAHGKQKDQPLVLIRGGGDLATGVAIVLVREGFRVLITELPAPLVVRRKVSFAQAVFDGICVVEEVTGEHALSPAQVDEITSSGKVAILVDPESTALHQFRLAALVDARMLKTPSGQNKSDAPLVIGLGPGFIAGQNCHAVIETKRGENLGRVYWQGGAEANTGIPEPVNGYGIERVLYAPADGLLHACVEIGDVVQEGETVAQVNGENVAAKFKGVIRGLIQDGMMVRKGMKIGDVDPRCDRSLCFRVSDKALAVGNGVLAAIRSLDEGEHK
mgnify:CR=1 FL=1